MRHDPGESWCIGSMEEAVWIALPDTEQSRLGMQACTLGDSACIGARVWDRQMKMRVRLGPLDAARFNDFLPGAPAARLLERLLQLCLGTSLACDTVLVLEAEAVPAPVLCSGTSAGMRLGYDTWLSAGARLGQRDDARFTVIA
jgi:type VI secretion system protein ImpH